MLAATTTNELPQWKDQEPGDSVYGELLNIRVFPNQFGEAYVLTIADEDRGDINVFCPTQLRSQCEDRKIQPGMIVAIKYVGLQKSAHNQEYKAFWVDAQWTDGDEPADDGEGDIAKPTPAEAQEPAKENIPFKA